MYGRLKSIVKQRILGTGKGVSCAKKRCTDPLSFALGPSGLKFRPFGRHRFRGPHSAVDGLAIMARILGRSFVKRLALCYQTVVCLSVCLSCLSVQSVLSVCDVGALWPNGWTDQDKTWHACIGFGPGHIVLDGDAAPPPQRGTAPQFSAHIRCGQMTA